jgi:hypothetical protein
LDKGHAQSRLKSPRPEFLIIGQQDPERELILVHLRVQTKYREAITTGDDAKRNFITPVISPLSDHIQCAVPPTALDSGEYILAIHDRRLDFDRRAIAYEFGIDGSATSR